MLISKYHTLKFGTKNLASLTFSTILSLKHNSSLHVTLKNIECQGERKGGNLNWVLLVSVIQQELVASRKSIETCLLCLHYQGVSEQKTCYPLKWLHNIFSEKTATYRERSLCVAYLRESHVDEIEPALQSLGDHHPAAARWTHGGQ